jgi:hypothetical protein
MRSRSLYSQLQEVLAELWLRSEHRKDMALPVERIEAALDEAEDYPTDDPQTFDELVQKARDALHGDDLKTLDSSLRELAELSRAGATSFG